MSYFLDDATESLVIFSDLKSALEAICNEDTNLTQSIIIILRQIYKPSILQWNPAHVGIGGANVLIKKARDLGQHSTVSSEVANTVAKRKISNQHFIKPTISELNCPRNLSSIVASLRTGCFKGMKISPDNSPSYPIFRNCAQNQLPPDNIFHCKAILASFFKT
ncbi:hypothetical protein TNCV_945281 [Trichonephila clavipes]|nr:hypothetical protein TNCV_945281 [Trichonephila clavipes]